ncbi:hypothetical protein GFK82_00616 [Candidatus Steffania adelgidicola]|nr:hypothetical protein GFK82_00616 [Candidatus Steffania adelgidicola]
MVILIVQDTLVLNGAGAGWWPLILANAIPKIEFYELGKPMFLCRS